MTNLKVCLNLVRTVCLIFVKVVSVGNEMLQHVLLHELNEYLISYLQFALLIEVEDAFFKVVHLTKNQGLIKHSVVTSQQGQSFLLKDGFLLPYIWI